MNNSHLFLGFCLLLGASGLHAEPAATVRTGVMDKALESIIATSGPRQFQVLVTLKPESGTTAERTYTAFLDFLAQLRTTGETANVLNPAGAASAATLAPVSLKASSRALKEVASLSYVDRIRLNQRGAPAAPPTDLLKVVAKDAIGRYGKRHPGENQHVADGIHPRVKSTIRTDSHQIEVICDLFGGFAPIWHGHPVKFLYTEAGQFISESGL